MGVSRREYEIYEDGKRGRYKGDKPAVEGAADPTGAPPRQVLCSKANWAQPL